MSQEQAVLPDQAFVEVLALARDSPGLGRDANGAGTAPGAASAAASFPGRSLAASRRPGHPRYGGLRPADGLQGTA